MARRDGASGQMNGRVHAGDSQAARRDRKDMTGRRDDAGRDARWKRRTERELIQRMLHLLLPMTPPTRRGSLVRRRHRPRTRLVRWRTVRGLAASKVKTERARKLGSHGRRPSRSRQMEVRRRHPLPRSTTGTRCRAPVRARRRRESHPTAPRTPIVRRPKRLRIELRATRRPRDAARQGERRDGVRRARRQSHPQRVRASPRADRSSSSRRSRTS